MKTFGCVLGILGIVVGATSLVIFGTAIFRASEARQIQAYPLQPGVKFSSDPIPVDTSRFCMIAVKAKIHSKHAAKKTGPNDDNKFALQFDFPFQYTVYDSAGKELFRENDDFSNSTGNFTSTSQEDVNEDGGTAEIKIDYAKFTPPSSGEIKIEARLDPDSTYEATLESPQLLVYDRVSKHAKSVVTGVILIAAGGIMALIGFVLFMVGFASKARSAP